MSYTAAPTKRVVFSDEKIVFQLDGYEVGELRGRLYLYRKGYRLAELVSGYDSLTKSYKGSFEVWIEKIKNKDLAKIETIKDEIEELKKTCLHIEDVHS